MQDLAELSIGSRVDMVQISENGLEKKLLDIGFTFGDQFEVVWESFKSIV